jgi:hypothetical protein
MAARELAERAPGLVSQADALERGERRAAVGAARAPPPGQARERAHEGDVERADREVQPRALGLGDDAAASAHLELAGDPRQVAEQGAEERRLAAAVGAEQPGAGPRHQREVEVLDGQRPAVAAAQAAGAHERIGRDVAVAVAADPSELGGHVAHGRAVRSPRPGSAGPRR